MIGVTIKTFLEANSALTALVPAGRIFPYYASENIALPLVIYTIDSLDPGYDKTDWTSDQCTFSVYSFANDYMTLQNIAAQVRIALERKRDSTISEIRMTGQSEGYNITENCFLNKLEFKVEITTI